jgi:type II secretory pathway pseudopilin PulG
MFTSRHKHRRGFTLIEAVVSTALTVLAGSAVLLGIASAVMTTDDTLARTQAAGMAQQVMDEIAGQIWCEDPQNPYQYPLTPSSYEAAGVARERYNDIDDYVSSTSQPPEDRWGYAMGSEDGHGGQRDPALRAGTDDFARWEQIISVYYVSASNQSVALNPGQTSQYRAVEVKINFKHPQQGTRNLATLRRVFTYVPIQ